MLLRNQRALSTSGECTGPRSPLHPFQASSLVKPVLRLAVEGCDSPPGALRAPTSPLRGEAMLRPPTECPRFPTRRAPRADLPTAWGGNAAHADLPTAWGGRCCARLLSARDSPPGALRAPTSPLRGEAMLRPPTECPRFSTRRAPRADLPTAWGGDAAPAY